MFKTHEMDFIILILLVGDLLFSSNSKGIIEAFKKKMAGTFDVKLFGPVFNFLGWEIRRTTDGIWITQRSYDKEIITKNSLEDWNGFHTPLAVNSDQPTTQQV